jgi:sugar phosphate isomerase/epimerase
MREFSLEPITIFDASPPDLVSIAASTGCQHVSLWVHAPVPGMDGPDLRGDAALRRETKRRLADTGVRVLNIECFNLSPTTDFDLCRRSLETGAELGGQCATAIAYGNPDKAAIPDRFARLAEIAGQCGLQLNVEFISMGDIRTLDDATRLVAGVPNAGITVDLLHVVRTGASPADVARLPAGSVGHIQICDGPAVPVDALAEGSTQRANFGEGVFPVQAFAASFPPSHHPLGIEVPLQDLMNAGVAPAERAKRVVNSLRRVLG